MKLIDKRPDWYRALSGLSSREAGLGGNLSNRTPLMRLKKQVEMFGKKLANNPSSLKVRLQAKQEFPDE